MTLLSTLLAGSLLVWHRAAGSVSASSITTRKTESFYWVTIMFSQTLGTALGDWTADSAGLGFGGGTFLFGGLLLVVVGAYYFTRVSRTVLFGSAGIHGRMPEHFSAETGLGYTQGVTLHITMRAGRTDETPWMRARIPSRVVPGVYPANKMCIRDRTRAPVSRAPTMPPMQCTPKASSESS